MTYITIDTKTRQAKKNIDDNAMVRVFTNHQSKHGSWGHEPWLKET